VCCVVAPFYVQLDGQLL